MTRVKFTTTLEEEVLDIIRRLAPDYKTTDMNYVIEEVMKEKWEAVQNEMEKKRRDN